MILKYRITVLFLIVIIISVAISSIVQPVWAAVDFVGSAENSAISGADVTITFPGGVLKNDLAIVSYAIGDSDFTDHNMNIISPTGYTEVADLFASDTRQINLGVFWKIMGDSPDVNVTVDGLGGSNAGVVAVLMIFRKVNTTIPMDVTPTTATALNTMHPNPPSIDHDNPTGVLTVIVGASGHTLGEASTYTFPTGYTINAIDRGVAGTPSNSPTIGMGYRTNPNDPEDPGLMTLSGTDNTAFSWAATTIAIRPSSTIPSDPAVAICIITLVFVLVMFWKQGFFRSKKHRRKR